MKYLLDTNICIYYLKGKFNLVERFNDLGIDNLFISEITVAELKFGAAKSDRPAKSNQLIAEFIESFERIPIYNSLDIYAKEKARLSKMGNIVDDFDLLIGATAIANDLTLVTNNEKHFQRLELLKIENWTK